MDIVKIGKYISECRKRKGLTQMQLAEKLNITDRAVSKWERGKALPDSSIMLELCEILEISVSELLIGEVLEMNDYSKQAERNLVEIIKLKEEADKRLLFMEIVIAVLGLISLFSFIFMAAFIELKTWLRVLLIAIGFVVFFVAMFSAMMIEQVAGYYECKYCKNRYVPTYKQINMAPHIGRTRYMKCPKCQKKSWQIKVISKEC